MRNLTTCLNGCAMKSAYSAYYPRIVVSAHRLTSEGGETRSARSSAFLLLVKRGCEGADSHLRALRLTQPDRWAAMTLDDRVRSAVLMASLAMEHHLQSGATNMP